MKRYMYGLGIMVGMLGCVVSRSSEEIELAKRTVTIEKLRQHTEILADDSC